MKVKEVDRTANIAWSPAPQVPIYLAAGTAAQQLDATFSTTSSLELYTLNLSETGHDMPVIASLPVEQRFHKVIWGQNGMEAGQTVSGLIVGGSDRGVINVYDADKLIKGEDCVVMSENKHTGPVAALDFNPYQHNLLASGASESEIFIWDVNKKTAPMNPGPKSQPLDDVRCVAWNKQVQHILASAFASRCLVWDLRKNDPIIKVSDSTSRMRCKIVAWHPDVATQLCLASEDDHTPIIQIWDLRAASSPLKTLEGHTKGILSLAWCKDDSDLLLSCGKDNRIIVWNPNQAQGEILAELPTSNQWSFDVSWCPRNPAIIASSSFDGRVSVYSLMGGQQQVQPTNRITESFGPDMQNIQQTQQPNSQVTMQLKKPPKWLSKPCGASFGFGGRLVSFENVKQTVSDGQGGQQTKRVPQVYISRVVTEQQLVDRSSKLETSLQTGNHADFIQVKVSNMEDEDEIKVWKFIGASFSNDPATEYLSLLDINLESIREQLTVNSLPDKTELKTMNGVANDISCMKIADQSSDDFQEIAEVAAEKEAKPTALDIGFDIDASMTTDEGELSLALLTGNIELGVKLCIKQRRWADALILSAQAGPTVVASTRALYFQQENCGGGSSALVEAVASDSWEKLVTNADLESWKQVICAVIVYCDLDRRLQLAALLAARLYEAGTKYRTASTLCYIVSMDMEKVLDIWVKEASSPDQLQDMVEIVVMLRAAIQAQGLNANLGAESKLAARLASYAVLLASQGCLESALVYLGDTSTNLQLQELKERLTTAVAGPVKTAGHQQQQQHQHQPVSRQGSGAGSRPLSRQSSYSQAERKSSFGPGYPANFNTGLPSNSAQPANFNTGLPGNNQSNYGMSAPVSNYGAMPPAPAPVSSYGAMPPAPTPAPVSNYGGMMTPAAVSSYGGMAPAPTSQPPVYTSTSGYMEPTQAAAPVAPPPGEGLNFVPAGTNPLLKRTRTVDPSIVNSGYNTGSYAQGYGQQGGYGGGGFGAPAPVEQQPAGAAGQPNIFTPDPVNMMTPARTRTNSISGTSGAALLPPTGFKYTPDHGGPGWRPPTSSGSGWNDPPPMMSKPKTPTVAPTNTYNQGPITTPLFNPGAAVEPPAAAPAEYGAAPQMMQPQPPANNGWSGFQPAAPVEQPAAPAAPQKPPTPEPPAPLAPIPQEHQEIQVVLDGLLTSCQQASNHPQTRRKLEDVQTKLDILYNKLRNEVLSMGTLQGLHQIVGYIRQYDYPSCTQVVSGLIAGGSFSELADFMPGIKVLIQVAHQAGVYLQQS